MENLFLCKSLFIFLQNIKKLAKILDFVLYIWYNKNKKRKKVILC